MAWLRLDKSGRYHLGFRYGDRKFTRSLGTTDPVKANSRLERFKETVQLVESGRLELPEKADIPTFLLSDGKLPGKPTVPELIRLPGMFVAYRESIPPDTMEVESLATATYHMNHFERILGKGLVVRDLAAVEKVQGYINKRCKEKGRRGKRVSSVTIKKELTTLRGVWIWAQASGHALPPFPSNKQLRFPKEEEKEPFQTWAEIEYKIEVSGITNEEIEDLWDCLYLIRSDINSVLTTIHGYDNHNFLYAMAYTAAHTGARRSELMRSRPHDLNFKTHFITLREKKKNKSRYTKRRVPMSDELCSVLEQWFDRRLNGRFTFCLPKRVLRSSKTRTLNDPLTPSEASDYLNRSLDGTKWERIRGWHVFRHSFISNCASQGIDQRMIDEWVGHQTEAMRKRYRHLLPEKQHEALNSAFGRNGK